MKAIRLAVLVALAAAVGLAPRAVAGPEATAAGPANAIRAGHARFEVLTPTMVRLEYSPDGRFENAPTMVAQDRTPIGAYTSSVSGGVLTIRTAALVLRYRIAGGQLSPSDLSIVPKAGGWAARPSWSDPAGRGNLGGWVRGLDDDAGPVPLHPGLLTRAGWYLLDDTTDALLTARPPGYATRPLQADYQDGYFFGYGHDYARGLSDLRTLSGPAPLLPRSAFGVWFSRYFPYSAADYKTLLAQFRRNRVPLDTLSIDTDWKRQLSPLAPVLAGAVVGSGRAFSWNGWEWNRSLFPHPAQFLRWLHRQGVDVALNIHPSIDSTDPKYAATVARTGPLKIDPGCTLTQIDPLGQCHVFDLTQQRQIAAYLGLQAAVLADGVDEWWLDWCCDATVAGVGGLTPDTWFNSLETGQLGKRGDRWLVLSRVGGSHQGDDPVAGPGPGIFAEHRYAIHFTGDTCATWAMLGFEAKLTTEEGNVGLPYVSDDIGSFNGAPVHKMCGATAGGSGAVDNPTMYARWVQLGAFQPILRLHSNHGARLPWEYPQPARRAAADALRLREQLVPYLYTVAREAYDSGLPIDRALYLSWPNAPAAYRHPGEYTVGSDVLVRPVSAAGDPAQATVWFPPGRWVDYFSGRTFTGPSTRRLSVPLDRIPIFVRDGATIVTQPPATHTPEGPRDRLVLTTYGGAEWSTSLYDDAGSGFGYQHGAYTWTPVTHDVVGRRQSLTIGPAEGGFTGELGHRAWTVEFRDIAPPSRVTVDGQLVPWRYVPVTRTLTLRTGEHSTSQPLRVVVTPRRGRSS
ncbi:MAG TPA: TIM-barrel domain-containing protein [Mycobacteriales bacterium]|nr:TIM-barrel domain-containing protein [Mycobacteriales bacterium]HWB68132.1 TIM-barrel domain-containing protein [Mycobacteriales bacterium]